MKDIKLFFVAALIFLGLKVIFEVFGKFNQFIFIRYPLVKPVIDIITLLLLVYILIKYLFQYWKKQKENKHT